MLSGLLAGMEKVFAGDGRIGADGSSGDQSESLPVGGGEDMWDWRGVGVGAGGGQLCVCV